MSKSRGFLALGAIEMVPSTESFALSVTMSPRYRTVSDHIMRKGSVSFGYTEREGREGGKEEGDLRFQWVYLA